MSHCQCTDQGARVAQEMQRDTQAAHVEAWNRDTALAGKGSQGVAGEGGPRGRASNRDPWRASVGVCYPSGHITRRTPRTGHRIGKEWHGGPYRTRHTSPTDGHPESADAGRAETPPGPAETRGGAA